MSNIIIIIAVVVIVGVIGYAVVLNYFESLPPNVQFVSFPTDTITVVEGSTAKIDFDIKNFEDYAMSDVLIKTKFDGDTSYATIIDFEIVIPELNVNQNTGVKTIKISTHQIEDDGVVTYSGKVFVEVLNANQTSDERPFELTIKPRK